MISVELKSLDIMGFTERCYFCVVLFNLLVVCCGSPVDKYDSSLPEVSYVISSHFLALFSVGFFLLCGLALLGCACWPRKDFRTSGNQNSAIQFNENRLRSNSEFVIFPPSAISLQPLPSSLLGNDEERVIFEPLPDILPKRHINGQNLAQSSRPAHFSALLKKKSSLHDWFDDPSSNFPRNQLQYLQEVGRGWFGRVVEGEAQMISSEQEKTAVIVKILREEATPSEHLYFLHEVKPYRDLYHRNIIRLLGRCLESDPFLLIMEHTAINLKSYLIKCRDKVVQPGGADYSQQLLKMACDITSGLSYMHENNFSHIDLAAHNCFLSVDDVVKIGDYGTSFYMFQEDYYCLDDIALPLRWYSPEALCCSDSTIETKEITKEANVWSLGIVFWEMLSLGELPYPELKNEDVLQKVIVERTVQPKEPQSICLFTKQMYQIMQLCWKPLALRPKTHEIQHFLHQLQNQEVYLKSFESFEDQWNAMHPRNNSLTESAILKFENDFVARVDARNFNFSLSSEYSYSGSSHLNSFHENSESCRSPSLRALNGSFDELVPYGSAQLEYSDMHRSSNSTLISSASKETSIYGKEEVTPEQITEALRDLDAVLGTETADESQLTSVEVSGINEEITLLENNAFAVQNESYSVKDVPVGHSGGTKHVVPDVRLGFSVPLSNTNVLHSKSKSEDADLVTECNDVEKCYNAHVTTCSTSVLNNYPSSFNTFSEVECNLSKDVSDCYKTKEFKVSDVPSIFVTTVSDLNSDVQVDHESDNLSYTDKFPHNQKKYRFVLKKNSSDFSQKSENRSVTSEEISKGNICKGFNKNCNSDMPLTSTPSKNFKNCTSNQNVSAVHNKNNGFFLDHQDNWPDECSEEKFNVRCSRKGDMQINIPEIIFTDTEANENSNISEGEFVSALEIQELDESVESTSSPCDESPAPVITEPGREYFISATSSGDSFLTANSREMNSYNNNTFYHSCIDTSEQTVPENIYKAADNSNLELKDCPDSSLYDNENVFLSSSVTSGRVLHDNDTVIYEVADNSSGKIPLGLYDVPADEIFLSGIEDSGDTFSDLLSSSADVKEIVVDHLSRDEVTDTSCHTLLLEQSNDSSYNQPGCHSREGPVGLDSSKTIALRPRVVWEVIDLEEEENDSSFLESESHAGKLVIIEESTEESEECENDTKATEDLEALNSFAGIASSTDRRSMNNNTIGSLPELEVHNYESECNEAEGCLEVAQEQGECLDDYDAQLDNEEVLKVDVETHEAILVDTSESLIGFVPSRSIELIQECECLVNKFEGNKNFGENLFDLLQTSKENHEDSHVTKVPSTVPTNSDVADDAFNSHIGKTQSVYDDNMNTEQSVYNNNNNDVHNLHEVNEFLNINESTSLYGKEFQKLTKDFEDSLFGNRLENEKVIFPSDETLDILVNDKLHNFSPVVIEGNEILAGYSPIKFDPSDFADRLAVSTSHSPMSSAASTPCSHVVYTSDFESESAESSSSCSSTSGSFECIHNKFKNVNDIARASESNEVIPPAKEEEEENDNCSPMKVFSKTWDCHASPNKGLLKSPEKKVEPMKKSVSFHEDPHLVYQYPPASDSSEEEYVEESEIPWGVDYTTYADWDLNATEEDEIPEMIEIEELDSEPYNRSLWSRGSSFRPLSDCTMYTLTGLCEEDLESSLPDVSAPPSTKSDSVNNITDSQIYQQCTTADTDSPQAMPAITVPEEFSMQSLTEKLVVENSKMSNHGEFKADVDPLPQRNSVSEFNVFSAAPNVAGSMKQFNTNTILLSDGELATETENKEKSNSLSFSGESTCDVLTEAINKEPLFPAAEAILPNTVTIGKFSVTAVDKEVSHGIGGAISKESSSSVTCKSHDDNATILNRSSDRDESKDAVPVEEDFTKFLHTEKHENVCESKDVDNVTHVEKEFTVQKCSAMSE